MLIIKIQGGLGNQMFQYALYLQLKYGGAPVVLDKKGVALDNQHNGYELEKIFHVCPRYANEKDLRLFYSKSLFYKIKRRLIGRSKIIDEFKLGFNYKRVSELIESRVGQKKFAYLTGYFQNEKYFQNVKNKLKNAIF